MFAKARKFKRPKKSINKEHPLGAAFDLKIEFRSIVAPDEGKITVPKCFGHRYKIFEFAV